MRNFLSFFVSRSFFLNLLLALVVVAAVIFGVSRWMEKYTRHGEYVVVPELTGKQLFQLPDFLRDKPVTYEVIDSIYDPSQKPGLVLRQDPEPGSKVKYNRTVYLYVTGMVPPQIEMPKLLDRSERQARLILETYGLKTGRVSDREADCNGCVVAQEWRGREIAPGEPIKKGSVIDLVIGRKESYIGQHANDTLSSD